MAQLQLELHTDNFGPILTPPLGHTLKMRLLQRKVMSHTTLLRPP